MIIEAIIFGLCVGFFVYILTLSVIAKYERARLESVAQWIIEETKHKES